MERVPKYKNGSTAIPKDEIVVPYSVFLKALTEQLEELERDIPLKIQEAIDAINEDAHLVIREPAGEIISKIVLSHIREQKEIIKKQ